MGEEATLDEFAATSDIEDKPAEQPESRFWGTVPEGWELMNGSDIYDVNPNPKPDGEPNTYIEMDALDTELPWPRYFGERDASEYSGKTFSAGDTLFARITPCTENGKAALVPEIETEVGIGSTEFAVLSPKRSSINPWFLYYLGKSHPIHNYAVSRMRGSTGRQRVPFSVFRRELDIALPPLEEQRKIATVLYTIDQAIQKTEEIIEQANHLKSGVTQQVFTEGVEDHDSYIETKSGRTPENWELVRFEEVIEETRYGTDNKSNTDGSGFPTFRIPNIVEKRITLDDLKHTPLDNDEIDRLKLEEGDILVIRTNGNPDYVGRCATFSERDEPFVFASYLIRVRVDESRVRPAYVREFLNSNRGRSEMAGWIRSSAGNYNLSVGAMEKFQIPVPPLEEQDEMVEKIGAAEQIIETNRQYRSQLRRLKQGLMQDLLSGAVRTHEAAIPDEALQSKQA